MRRSLLIIGSVLLVIANACGGDSAPPKSSSDESKSAVTTTPATTDPDETVTTEPTTDAPTTVAEPSTTTASAAGQPPTTVRRSTTSTTSTSTSSTSSSSTSTVPPGVADVRPTTLTVNPAAGQASSHQFLITNVGQGVLELRSITVVSGSGLSISMGSCGPTLPAGNLCFPTIDVVALPSGSTATGQVRIVTNSPTSPDYVTINISVP